MKISERMKYNVLMTLAWLTLTFFYLLSVFNVLERFDLVNFERIKIYSLGISAVTSVVVFMYLSVTSPYKSKVRKFIADNYATLALMSIVLCGYPF